MHCDEFRSSLKGYLDDVLPADERGHWRLHLGDCRECREWAGARDPALLFAALSDPAVDLARVEACTLAVRAQVRQQRTQRRLTRRRAVRWLSVAAAAVVVMAAALLIRHDTVAPPAAEMPRAAVVAAEDPPPRLEVDMDGAGVRVYNFAVTDGNDLAVAFVVNPSLES